MALHRGIQSAIFYYLSCAPCTEQRIRKRRRQDAERNRADREALEADMPGLYRHPEPSSTNPYWQAEIDAGPTPARVKKKVTESQKGAKSGAIASGGGGSNVASSVTLGAIDGQLERDDGIKAGLGPHQREDEVLWGMPTDEDKSMNGHLPRRPQKAKARDEPDLQKYQHLYNAAINDLHPPTTRKVSTREEVMWMLQPPPVADVMSGKENVSLRRKTSGLSRPSPTMSATPLSRQVSEQILRKKLHAGEAPGSDSSRDFSGARSAGSRSQSLDSLLADSTMPSSDAVYTGRSLHKPENATDSNARKQSQTSESSDSGRLISHKEISRPHLPTILSDRLVARGERSQMDDRSKPSSSGSDVDLKDPPTSKSTQESKDSEYFPDFAPTNPDQQLKTLSKSHPWIKTRVVVPHNELVDDPGVDPPITAEAFDSWYTPEFELPQWIHDHTKREVRQRWSFDM